MIKNSYIMKLVLISGLLIGNGPVQAASWYNSIFSKVKTAASTIISSLWNKSTEIRPKGFLLIPAAIAVGAATFLGVCSWYFWKNKKQKNDTKKESENSTQGINHTKDPIEDPVIETPTPKPDNSHSLTLEKLLDINSYFFHELVFNGSTMYGRSVNLSDNILLTQLKVFNQNECKEINNKSENIGGGSNSCAYHAIKNAIIGYSLFTKSSDSKDVVSHELNDIEHINNFFAPLRKDENDKNTAGILRIDIMNTRNLLSLMSSYRRQISALNLSKLIDDFCILINVNNCDLVKSRLHDHIEKIIHTEAMSIVSQQKTKSETIDIFGMMEKIRLQFEHINVCDIVINKAFDYAVKNERTENSLLINFTNSVLDTGDNQSTRENRIPGDQVKKDGKGELLLTEEIISLIEILKQEKVWPVNLPYAVIDNLDNLQYDNDSKNYPYLEKRENDILTAIKNNKIKGTVAFFLSSSKVMKDNSAEGVIGHWIQVLRHNDGNKVQYVICDSLNYPRLFGSQLIKRFISHIEGEKVADIIQLPHKNKIECELEQKYKKKDRNIETVTRISALEAAHKLSGEEMSDNVKLAHNSFYS